jgi:hypothetical protein
MSEPVDEFRMPYAVDKSHGAEEDDPPPQPLDTDRDRRTTTTSAGVGAQMKGNDVVQAAAWCELYPSAAAIYDCKGKQVSLNTLAKDLYKGLFFVPSE